MRALSMLSIVTRINDALAPPSAVTARRQRSSTTVATRRWTTTSRVRARAIDMHAASSRHGLSQATSRRDIRLRVVETSRRRSRQQQTLLSSPPCLTPGSTTFRTGRVFWFTLVLSAPGTSEGLFSAEPQTHVSLSEIEVQKNPKSRSGAGCFSEQYCPSDFPKLEMPKSQIWRGRFGRQCCFRAGLGNMY